MCEKQEKDRATMDREREVATTIDKDGVLKSLKKENENLYSYLQGKEREIKDLENAIIRLALRLKK